MQWKVEFNLERDDEYRKDDESWFDEEQIKNEIKSWLDDLDFKIKKIQIKEAL